MSTRRNRPRLLVATQTPAQLTHAQRWAQDETVAVLQRYADAAEGHLRRRAEELRAQGVALCQCGIPEVDCQCPLRRRAAGA